MPHIKLKNMAETDNQVHLNHAGGLSGVEALLSSLLLVVVAG